MQGRQEVQSCVLKFVTDAIKENFVKNDLVKLWRKYLLP